MSQFVLFGEQKVMLQLCYKWKSDHFIYVVVCSLFMPLFFSDVLQRSQNLLMVLWLCWAAQWFLYYVDIYVLSLNL